MGLLLFIISLVFTVLFTSIWFPINIVWSLITFKWKKGAGMLNEWFYFMAEIIDVFANHSLSALLNRIMIKGKDKFLFTGKDRDTLSYTIAVNDQRDTLTPFGKFWGWFLDTVDKDHLKKALDNKRKRDIEGSIRANFSDKA